MNESINGWMDGWLDEWINGVVGGGWGSLGVESGSDGSGFNSKRHQCLTVRRCIASCATVTGIYQANFGKQI